MRRFVVMTLLFAAALTLRARGPAAAQVDAIGDAARSPRFLVASAPGARLAPLDVERVPMLGRRLTLELDNVSVKTALETITTQSGLVLAYSDDIVRSSRKIQLRATGITVVAALTDVLYGVGVDVVFNRDGRASLVRRLGRASGATGAIVGRITDAKTGDPLAGADVSLDGTKLRTASGEKGYYKLSDVPVGSYTLSVRRVGYAKQSRAVVVQEGEATADVALQAVVTQLDELVTTVTGEQRARELGHVVGRINADSVVREAPVSNLAELLAARVSGLQVFQNQGTVGGNVKLQSRAPNSFLFKSEPIVVVDGVRYTSSAFEKTYAWPFNFGPDGVEESSPLNNLAPSDIQTIEVVKGPSAATLYGTDAANGVIVITTKRGRAGATQWNGYTKMASNGIPKQHFQESYYPWGHALADPNTPIRCSRYAQAGGSCLQDSAVAVPNPLNEPQWSMLAAQPAWNYGGNVNGGSQQFKYYLSADINDATGPVQMPPAIEEMLAQEMGIAQLPIEQRRPNAQSQLNLRANASADLGHGANIGVTAGYVRGSVRSMQSGGATPYATATTAANTTKPYGTFRSPAAVFLSSSTEKSDRFVGSANGQWNPISWLQTRATVGIDLAGRNRYSFTPPGADPQGFGGGAVGDNRLRQLALTGDFGATALARKGRMTFRTSAGAQYVRTLNDELMSFGYELPPGGTSVGEASAVSTRQAYSEAVTLGSFFEETFGLNDRLFVTGAVRLDGASAFGQNYDVATYPKVSLSWILSDEPFMPRVPGLDELRLRFARGTSGQQAKAAWTRLAYTVVNSAIIDGDPGAMVSVANLGNADLRPERVTENEFGFDAAALNNRVRLGMTWYNRRTTDQITTQALGSAFGYIYSNLGLTTQHGFEIDLTATPIETKGLSLDLTLRHGLHRNKLVDYGNAAPLNPVNNPNGGLAEGYSLGARFMRPIIGVNDLNNDNIIDYNEIVFTQNPVYVGEGTPPITQSLAAVVGLFDRRLRISALFERKLGFVQFDQLQVNRCYNANCYELIAVGVPLDQQAAARAAYDVGYAEPQPGDFTRFRELSVAAELPSSWARRFRVRTALVSLGVRNLKLWTKFKGPDPESAAVGSQYQYTSAYNAGSADGIPLARTWSLRVDLGL